MKNTKFTYFLVIFLIVISSLSRLIPHLENFSPILGISLFGAVYLSNKWLRYLLPISVMFFTDLIIGIHTTMLFNYISIALMIYMATRTLKSNNWFSIFGNSIIASVIFFIISNFGFWLTSGLYTLNLNGLIQCFELAIPFYRNTLISSVISTAVLFGLYQSSLLFVQKMSYNK